MEQPLSRIFHLQNSRCLSLESILVGQYLHVPSECCKQWRPPRTVVSVLPSVVKLTRKCFPSSRHSNALTETRFIFISGLEKTVIKKSNLKQRPCIFWMLNRKNTNINCHVHKVTLLVHGPQLELPEASFPILVLLSVWSFHLGDWFSSDKHQSPNFKLYPRNPQLSLQ